MVARLAYRNAQDIERENMLLLKDLRTLKNKIYKYMTSVSKIVYVNKLADIVNEYNDTYHSAMKIKPFDVKSSSYIDFGIEKDSESEVDDHVRISKYKKIFAEGYAPSWCEEVFVIKKVINAVLWMYVTENFNVEEIV